MTGRISHPAGAPHTAPAIARRDFLALIGAGAAASRAPRLFAAEGAAARKPNIVIILADDLGYADVGYQGCRDVPTPHVDSIARNGVQFTDGYVSGPVCSPTRAGLLTGRYQQRFGHELNPGPPFTAETGFGLPLSQITLAELLKRAGYATGLVGKWHLGLAPQFHPLRRGFDEYFGFLHGAHDYLNPLADPRNRILRGTRPVEQEEYLTDAFRREAVAFLDRHHGEPFFLYLAPNAVHAPLEALPQYLDRFKDLKDEKRRTFAAMLSALDDLVGAVLGKLRDEGIEDHTLIFFLSDNGGPTPVNTSRNAPLSGYKAQVLEGGIRVPFALQWKARVKPGRVCRHPVSALDLLPTALAAAGAQLPPDPPCDGVDLLPFVAAERLAPPHEALFWRFGAQRAVRMGDWKLLQQGNESVRLHNLVTDVSEKKDLAAKEPLKVKELERAYARWNAQLIEPLWKPAARAKARAKKQRKKK